MVPNPNKKGGQPYIIGDYIANGNFGNIYHIEGAHAKNSNGVPMVIKQTHCEGFLGSNKLKLEDELYKALKEEQPPWESSPIVLMHESFKATVDGTKYRFQARRTASQTSIPPNRDHAHVSCRPRHSEACPRLLAARPCRAALTAHTLHAPGGAKRRADGPRGLHQENGAPQQHPCRLLLGRLARRHESRGGERRRWDRTALDTRLHPGRRQAGQHHDRAERGAVGGRTSHTSGRSVLGRNAQMALSHRAVASGCMHPCPPRRFGGSRHPAIIALYCCHCRKSRGSPTTASPPSQS